MPRGIAAPSRYVIACAIQPIESAEKVCALLITLRGAVPSTRELLCLAIASLAMIEAVALGLDDSVYSVKRGGGASHVVANTKDAARSLYETSDKLDALWVSASGAIHAVGKRYHTNLGGTWRASKLPARAFAIWGTSDDDLYVGGVDGELMRRHAGTWTELANTGELVTAIDGAGSTVFFTGYFDFVGVFAGTTLEERKWPGHLQALYCASPDHLWLCATDAVYEVTSGAVIKLVSTNDELYGVGVGSGGVFIHRGIELLRLDGDHLVEVRDNGDNALMEKRATYATRMTSNGRRVVAAGARSVLVEDGDGFVEWPALAQPPVKAPAKPKAAAKKSKRGTRRA